MFLNCFYFAALFSVPGLKKNITRLITLLVAFQLLNLSVYAQDFKPLWGESEQGEHNITETVSEFVVEVLLGHKHAIPEQSQHHKDLHFHKHISFKAINFSPFNCMPELLLHHSFEVVPVKESYAYLYQQEINPPPPKA